MQPPGTRRDARAHWEAIWEENAPQDLSWTEEEPRVSLELLAASGVAPPASVLDVGAGASLLVDALLARGFCDLAALDVAPASLARAKARLGPRAGAVTWLVGDVRRASFGRRYDVWHDRAVFHFLVDPADRDAYRRLLHATLAPGGHAIVATFAPDGPDTCSGLPVARYDASSLARELGLALVQERRATHRTPWGATQSFQYVLTRAPSSS